MDLVPVLTSQGLLHDKVHASGSVDVVSTTVGFSFSTQCRLVQGQCSTLLERKGCIQMGTVSGSHREDPDPEFLVCFVLGLHLAGLED